MMTKDLRRKLVYDIGDAALPAPAFGAARHRPPTTLRRSNRGAVRREKKAASPKEGRLWRHKSVQNYCSGS
jgi:hypothetical protein